MYITKLFFAILIGLIALPFVIYFAFKEIVFTAPEKSKSLDGDFIINTD